MKCLILASGFGARLYPLTRNRAKALLEYEGKPVLSHIVGRVPQDINVDAYPVVSQNQNTLQPEYT